MKRIITLSFAVFLFSCEDKLKDDHYPGKIDFEYFTLFAPEDWNSFKRRGVDSIVGGLTDLKDTLRYDYIEGEYMPSGKVYYNKSKHSFSTLKINGMNSQLLRPHKPGEDFIGMFIRVDKTRRIEFYSYTLNEDLFLKIVKSVRFD